MKTISTLTADESGMLTHSEHAIERCPEADTGWAVATLGDPIPVNASKSTTLVGWGPLDGHAAIVGAIRIPLSQLA